ncbi:hypothetical protein TH53_20530 [Pedobacter lusitanus]|uniref:Lipoprotein n=1 Tax=Pedobacter lusitanus TaxID=1503925 RepID=A0A0D0F1E9_9SPHI|nr:hypothetical protein [Pedobacter lusitanus]KIO75463.1 hypothetical protein TH53_20530 [Pedobacter lusitanus]
MKNLLLILLLTIGVCHAQEKKIAAPKAYSLVGTIDKKIPVSLDFTVSKNMILGNIRYLNTKAKLPIRIIGYVNTGGDYIMEEYGKDGTIGAVINVKWKAGKLSGAWNPIGKKASYVIHLMLKDGEARQETFLPVTLAGTYTYQYGEKGYQGSIEIKKDKNNTYTYEIGSVTSDPARNQADASGTGIIIKDNAFVIDINKSCKFDVTFYNGFLIISSLDKTGASNCEFGFNATLEGTYLKVK